MKRIVLLALLTATVGISSAVTLTANDELAGAKILKREKLFYGTAEAGLISFTIDGIAHQGFCLSPDTYLGKTWDATVDYQQDYIGTIIDTAINQEAAAAAYYNKGNGHGSSKKFDANVWFAAAQVAIWETLAYYDPSAYEASKYCTDKNGKYDWNGYVLNGKGATYLVDYFGYVKTKNDIRISDENLKKSQWYRVYVPTDPKKSQVLAELGQPGTNGVPVVPGPVASVPFIAGFLAALKRRRK